MEDHAGKEGPGLPGLRLARQVPPLRRVALDRLLREAAFGELVQAADVVVKLWETFVAEDATLWEPFAQRGFTPDSGGTWLLPRRVGPARARELLLLGRRLTGREAADWQLVHQAVPAGEVESTAEATA